MIVSEIKNETQASTISFPFMWMDPMGTVWLRHKDRFGGENDICLRSMQRFRYDIGDVTAIETSNEAAWSRRMHFALELSNKE